MAGSSYGDDANISGSVTINDDGITTSDLRVESDTEAHMLFVDASENRVGIGTDAPDYTLDVAGDIGVDQYIYHNGDADTYIGFPGQNTINLVANGYSFLKYDGTIKINNANRDRDTQIMADDGHVVLHVDAGTNNVGIQTTSPRVPLDIYNMGGLILGYTRLNNADGAGNATYQVQASGTGFAVPTNRWRTDFTAPASGKVEINFRGALVSNTTGGTDWVALGLSDSDTYNSIGSKYEKVVDTPTEVASAGVTHRIVNHSWFCDGLTAGTSYSIYIGTVGRTTAHYWYWGGSDSYEHADIIITTTALPNTFVTD